MAKTKKVVMKKPVIPAEINESIMDSAPSASSTAHASNLNFDESNEDESRRPRKQMSKSKKAGVTFPVSRIHRHLKNGGYADRISQSASVYLAAALEYLIAETTELAGDAARDNKRQRITPRHIQLAVRNDEEINGLLKNVTIPGSGVKPHIENFLLKKGTDEKKAEKSSKAGESSKKVVGKSTKTAENKQKEDLEGKSIRKNTKSAPAGMNLSGESDSE